MTEIRRRLIVNADDFGLSAGVNEGILRAHRDGIVTSTSLMVRQPIEFAYSTARNTLGELPEPLTAISTSPGSAKFFNCSTKTHS